MTPRAAHEEWQPVCALDELEVERAATALVHGQAVAIFRLADDRVYALGNHDPFARAADVGKGIAKGIVGRRGDVPFVASPAHKHAFDLRTGRCLDDPTAAVPVYDVKVVDGTVHVGHRKAVAA
ncbi:nitrite reductase small subunit NirD [Nocardioides abyssi]|uniref:Nitrite reductase small subunit NirD n=1 Tax=Nocardioides abyssi TaxID=3058370 RepID=A0ABT8EWL3_9ACTN|nr:nitrite reductase small subunit NirD [Nocardioides abyssi]MDN4162530.1 nitrite reductase small subunit NirD [Nocardioides abyssi]